MAGLLEGQIAGAIYAGFKGRLLRGTFRRSESTTVDGLGDDVAPTITRTGCEGFVDESAFLLKPVAGIPETDAAVCIFAKSIPAIEPRPGDTIGMRGQWWQVRKVMVDPAKALWSCAAFAIKEPVDGS